MAYKSLYRKYRPSKFEDVYGQNFIIKTLNNAIENNKVSHAYLFTGTRGTGKTTIAKIFAKRVNCLNMVDNKPCGKCEMCLTENTDDIQDIIEIDAASNNGVDEIRELKNKIKLVPVMCKYKVYIIDEVHMLSTGAFNALLKTLEEPPSHVIFILATTDPQKLPITIISRCQRFDFKKISEDSIFERLRFIANSESIDVEDDALNEIAKMCDGAMRDAIGTLDQLSSYSEKVITIDDIYTLKGTVSTDILVELANSYIERDLNKILDIIENIYLNGKNFYLILESLLMLFRNILINKKAPKYFENKSVFLKNNILEMSEKLDIKSVENIIKKLEDLSKNIKDSNYPRVLFELCLLSEYNNDSLIEMPVKQGVTVKQSDIKQVENVYSKPIYVETKPNIELKSEIKITGEPIKGNMVNVVVNNSTSEIRFEFSPQTKNKKALINNTIALADTKHKKNVQDAYVDLDKYLIDNKYRNAATILKDSIVTAASEDHILLTYKYSSMVEENDNELNNIKELFGKLLNRECKVVAITEDEWKEERPYYLNLKKTQGKIELIEETIDEENIENKNKELNAIDNIVDIFGSDLVEMEG